MVHLACAGNDGEGVPACGRLREQRVPAGTETMLAPALLLMAAPSLGGMYPRDHWKYSVELTTSTFDEFISTNVDAGKTVRA